MSGMWGNSLKLSIFGESHGAALGATLTGLPSGVALDLAQIERELARRAPGASPLATARREADHPEIVSGFFEGRTTGTPLTALIRNADARSGDYALLKDRVRPGHADYTAQVRYAGYQDPRGGGHFSGRLTAPLVFAGAVCKQILAERGVRVFARVARVHQVSDRPLQEGMPCLEEWERLAGQMLPTLDPEAALLMEQAILAAKRQGDSVGGVIECCALGLPAGVGNPFFDSLESSLAHLLFSVPAVKGVEFGLGFEAAARLGSEVNDAFCYRDGQVVTDTNRCGGILGGIATGMPVVFRAAIRPTPSIAREQRTVSLNNKEETTLEVPGRHDPCIVPRAVPVIEAVAAIALLDQIKETEACRI